MATAKISRISRCWFAACHPESVFAKVRYLFVLSHMRSRSSVLSHVLGSNDEICGYTELHRSYLRRADLIGMRLDLSQSIGEPVGGKYLLDKILHNRHKISQRIFHTKRPRIIIMIREPQSTLQSIIRMGKLEPSRPYSRPDWAVRYYCERLAYLENVAVSMPSDYFYIESDDLVYRTIDVLKQLSEWLRLEVPLNREYSIFENTGVTGAGDPSDAIEAGVIIQTPSHDDARLPADLVERSRAAFNRCRSTIASHSFNQYDM